MIQLEDRDTLRAKVADDLKSLLGDRVPDGEFDRVLDHVMELMRPRYDQMSVDFAKLPSFVRNDLKESTMDDFGTKIEEELRHSSPQEVFARWLEWNGILNWSGRIVNALDGIRAASIQRKR